MYGQQIPSDTLRMLRNSESSPPSEHMCIIADTVVMYTKAFDRKLISSRQTLAFACMSKHEAEENETGTSRERSINATFFRCSLRPIYI